MRIEVTPAFERAVKRLTKRYSSLPADLLRLLDSLEANPRLGECIGRSCYKIRLAITAKGGGKSGGARVITYVRITAGYIALLTVYDKSEQDTISEARRDELIRDVEGLME